MSRITHTETGALAAPGSPVDVALRVVAAEVLSRSFTYGGWVPKLRWLVKPAIGTKLYSIAAAGASEDPSLPVQYVVVAEVTGFSVAYGERVPQLRWLSQPADGAKLYQDAITEPVAPTSSGADYKGHANLAEMLVTHLDNYRRALKFQRGHAKDADDRSWYDHELAALLDIEAACRADIKAAREAKANAAQ